MKSALVLFCLLILTASAIAAPAARYCLRGQSGATQGTEVCAYQTMAQCMAAKAGQNDQCFPAGKGKRTTTGSGMRN
jgi:hypothetical protein